jgi:heme A synthase
MTLAVIVWGAFVRVTGSGAGCADHWPLCNGELVPRAPRLETLIELTHRVTSGLAGLLSIAVCVLAFRRFERGSSVRIAAAAGLVLMLVEGAIGALLVKKGLVAQDASGARAFVVGLHLVNTFLLLGAQAFTVLLVRHPQPLALRAQPGVVLQLLLLASFILLLGGSGAVTALGDTLFPARSLAEGVARDFAADAHFLVRLRVWHPLLAILAGAVLVWVAQQLRAGSSSPRVSFWAWSMTAIYIAQISVGAANLWWLAPAPIQLIHLLFADLTWLSLVALSVSVLQDGAVQGATTAALQAGVAVEKR